MRTCLLTDIDLLPLSVYMAGFPGASMGTLVPHRGRELWSEYCRMHAHGLPGAGSTIGKGVVVSNDDSCPSAVVVWWVNVLSISRAEHVHTPQLSLYKV